MSKIIEFLESEEGKRAMDEFFNKLEAKADLRAIRFKKFEDYLETHSFDSFMDRMKSDNNDDYRDKCYKKGYEPYPTNLFAFLISYISENCEDAGLEFGGGDFLSEEYIFNGYLFQTFQGQGAFERVYKKVDGEWEFFLQI